MRRWIVVFGWYGAAALQSAALTPADLMCELLAKPGLVAVTDATPEFFYAFEGVLSLAAGAALRIIRPLAQLDKRQVMELGRHLPLELTFSCIAPVGELHCGHCNKCHERQAAFAVIEANDPTTYAQSPVSNP